MGLVDTSGFKRRRGYHPDEDDEEEAGEAQEDDEEGDDDKEVSFEGDGSDSDIEFIGIKHSVVTKVLELSTVRSLILEAVRKHPASMKHVEALRPTILDGLSSDSLRVALFRIAEEHPEIAAEISKRQHEGGA